MSAIFYVVGTPIGNLGEITLRALEVLKSVDVIFCEDTRRTVKLLNAYEIKKPLKSAPYFKENKAAADIIEALQMGQSVALVSDAGMPGVSDPGAIVVREVRARGFKVEVVGGVSSLTSFIAGTGIEFESFSFIGFLPPRVKDRQEWLKSQHFIPTIFFESPHRMESTLDLFVEELAGRQLILAKELSKISEAFYFGTPAELKQKISSYKGEWIGCLMPEGAVVGKKL
jgi:16S rRNA (cytidine1402-2'-O)-methyltransferase